jgi:hypothetical protein
MTGAAPPKAASVSQAFAAWAAAFAADDIPAPVRAAASGNDRHEWQVVELPRVAQPGHDDFEVGLN